MDRSSVLKPGDKVTTSGFDAVVIRQYSEGMYELRLSSGVCCVDIGDIEWRTAGAPTIDEHALDILIALNATPTGEDTIEPAWLAAWSRSFNATMQHGYLVRVGTKKAAITPTGRAFVAGVLFQSRRV